MDEVVLILEVLESAPQELANAMLDACSAAAVQGTCSFASTRAESSETPRASIGWDADHLVASLHLSVGGVVSERSLHFRVEDPPLERWRSTGLVAATVVGEARRAKELEAQVHAASPPSPTAQPTPAKKSPPRARPEPLAPPEPPFERLVLDLGVLVGNGLDGGSPRAGASTRLGLLIPKTPLLLDVATSFTIRPTDARGLLARWVTVGGGVGIRGALLERTIAIEGRLEGLAEWSGASVTTGGIGDSGGRVQPGIGVGVEVTWMFSRMIGLAMGIDGALVPSGTVFRVRGTSFGRSPPEHVAGYVGIRLGLF